MDARRAAQGSVRGGYSRFRRPNSISLTASRQARSALRSLSRGVNFKLSRISEKSTPFSSCSRYEDVIGWDDLVFWVRIHEVQFIMRESALRR